MNVEAAINRSGIWTAFRPVTRLVPPRLMAAQPAVAAKHLVRFDENDQPVYKMRCYTYQGTPVSPVLARRFDEWLAVDPVDSITALANLADREQIVSRQNTMVERKKAFCVVQGKEHQLYRSLVSVLVRLEAHTNDVVEGVPLRDDDRRHHIAY